MAFSLELSRYLEPNALSPDPTPYDPYLEAVAYLQQAAYLEPAEFSPYSQCYPCDPPTYLVQAAAYMDSPYVLSYSNDPTAPSTPDVREEAFEVASNVSKPSGGSLDDVERFLPIKAQLLSSDVSKKEPKQSENAKKPRKIKRNQVFCVHPSRGSKNHELMQCRPCKNFSTPEGCPDGAACNFCHYPHSDDPLQDANACDAEARRVLSMLAEDTKQNEADVPSWDEAWYLPVPAALPTDTAFDSPLLGA